MSRKDYIAISQALSDAEASESLCNRIADIMGADNPRFDRRRFMIACGLTEFHYGFFRTRSEE